MYSTTVLLVIAPRMQSTNRDSSALLEIPDLCSSLKLRQQISRFPRLALLFNKLKMLLPWPKLETEKDAKKNSLSSYVTTPTTSAPKKPTEPSTNEPTAKDLVEKYG